MSHPDEGMIHAWLDGELTPEEAAAMERRVATEPAFAAAVAEARGLIAASSRIIGALDAVPGRVIPGAGSSARRTRRLTRGFAVRPWVGIAAAMALTVGTAIVAWPPANAPDVRPVERRDDSLSPSDPRALASQAPPEREPAPPAPSTPALPAPIAPAPTRAPPVSAEAQEVSAPPTVADAAGAGAAAAAAVAAAGVGAGVARERTEPELAAAPRAARFAEPSRLSGVVTGVAVRDARAGKAAANEAEGTLLRTADVLVGCWRAAPPFVPDTLLRDLPIVDRRGDTLVVRLSPTHQVTVTQRGDTLSGGLRAFRADCPADRTPDPE
ncbi:MAG: hypothetical protein WD771_01325 [Gemmatimonadaceae bacterium]